MVNKDVRQNGQSDRSALNMITYLYVTIEARKSNIF